VSTLCCNHRQIEPLRRAIEVGDSPREQVRVVPGQPDQLVTTPTQQTADVGVTVSLIGSHVDVVDVEAIATTVGIESATDSTGSPLLKEQTFIGNAQP
jgi:hypothetical protein